MKKLVNLLQDSLVVGHALFYVENYAFLVDKKADPSRPVQSLDLAARIDKKREGQAQRLGEPLVGFEIVGAHTQHLGVAAFEGFDVLLERRHLGRSAAGEILEVEGEKNVLFAEVV